LELFITLPRKAPLSCTAGPQRAKQLCLECWTLRHAQLHPSINLLRHHPHMGDRSKPCALETLFRYWMYH